MLARHWSTVVKYWSNNGSPRVLRVTPGVQPAAGRMLVKHWSNAGQILVKDRVAAGPPRAQPAAGRMLVNRRSNTGQKLAKYWSNIELPGVLGAGPAGQAASSGPEPVAQLPADQYSMLGKCWSSPES